MFRRANYLAMGKTSGGAYVPIRVDAQGRMVIGGITAGLTYQGTWNANTNTPALASGVGTAGYYYIVSVAGSTNLDGVTDWGVGDWAIFNGTVWQKIDNSDSVSSVFSRTGAVVAADGDYDAFYINRDGSIALTGAWNTGAFAITCGSTIDFTSILYATDINDAQKQVIFLPDQTEYPGSLVIGDADINGSGGSQGHDCTFVGFGAGAAQTQANNCTLVGSGAGNAITTGNNNTFVGFEAGKAGASAYGRVAIGARAAYVSGGGNYSIYIGENAGQNNSGANNVLIGRNAGSSLTSGGSNIFIGFEAGENEAGATANKLIIANSNTATPLLQGSFSTPALLINANADLFTMKNQPTGGTALAVASTEFVKTYPIRYLQMTIFDYVDNTVVGDGRGYIHIPAQFTGMNLVEVHAMVITAGTTNKTNVQIHNLTQAADMLSTAITIDSTETGSDTADIPAVINTSEDDVATNDVLRADVKGVSDTPAKGLVVTLGFQKP